MHKKREEPQPSHHKTKDLLRSSSAWGVLILILSLAAFLRFVNLRQNPGWYSDEGVFISLGQNLLEGRWQIFGALVSPLDIQRPPVFPFLVMLVFRGWGADILALRFLTALCGTVDVLLLFLFVRQAAGVRLALLSAVILSILPWAVTFNRLGFSYNLMAPFFMAAIFSSLQFTREGKKRWAVLACVASALAFCTDYLGAVSIGVVLTVFLLYRPRWLIPGISLLALLVIVIVVPPVFQDVKGSVEAIRFITETKVAVSALMQVVNVLVNYGELLYREGWVFLALAGLFMVPHARLRGIVLLAVGTSLLLTIRTFPPVGRGMHYLIHLFPFFSLGLAVFLERSFLKVYAVLQEMLSFAGKQIHWLANNTVANRIWRNIASITAACVLSLVLASPVLWMFLADMGQSFSGYYFMFSGNNDIGLTSANDAGAVTEYLKENLKPTDLVLASPQILWAVPTSQQTDWGITAAYDHQDREKNRYAYSCSLTNVKYAVVDPLALNFVTGLGPQMERLVEVTSGWPVVFRAGELTVHENPLLVIGE